LFLVPSALFDPQVLEIEMDTDPMDMLEKFSSLNLQSNFRPLYGGAIESILPPEFKDVSDLREVPDHQEVFVHASEVSLITELVDFDKTRTDDLALEYYFQDLAKFNESAQTSIFTKSFSMDESRFMPHIGKGFPRMACLGQQVVQKYHSADADFDYVFMILVVVRLKNVETDILISLNLPFSDQRVKNVQLPADFNISDCFLSLDCLYLEDHSHSMKLSLLETIFPEIKEFQSFLYHFRIQDWSLFLCNPKDD
jgi:hypothetical protein